MCFNKTEGKLFLWLKKYYQETTREAKFDWCKSPKTDYYLPFDFYIKELNCIIELDSRQHFKQVLNWSPHNKYKIAISGK